MSKTPVPVPESPDSDTDDTTAPESAHLPDEPAVLPAPYHLTEEYRYGRRPSIAKLRNSQVSLFDIAFFIVELYMFQHILFQTSLGVLYGVILGLLAYLLIQMLLKFKNALFTPIRADSWGFFWQPDRLEPFWVAELDRYTGAREEEYHREYVQSTAESQAEAMASIRAEHDVEDEDIIYIRQVDRDEREITPDLGLRTNSFWIDRSDDPIKVYTTWRFGSGYSVHQQNMNTGQRTIIHSIAGLRRGCVCVNQRTYTEALVHHEIHELVHWALDREEQPESSLEELGWHGVIWDVQDYIQEGEHPDGPWDFEERTTRARLTSREAREQATALIPNP